MRVRRPPAMPYDGIVNLKCHLVVDLIASGNSVAFGVAWMP